MLNQGLILTSNRDYAQEMRLGLLRLGNEKTRIDIELDSLRAMQLVPQQYELILLDVMLDAMDGLQLLMLMKQQAPSTKFIIVGEVPDETSRAQAYQNGADFFIERPRTPVALQSALESIGRLLKPLVDSQPLKQDAEDALQSIADVVQTRCLSGNSVLLMVRSKNLSGDIFIYRGELFHAQYPGKSGESAFYDMCHWDMGMVRVKAVKLNHVPPRTIETPYSQLLAKTESPNPLTPDLRPRTGELRLVSGEIPPGVQVPDVMLEAPPLEDGTKSTEGDASVQPDLPDGGGTPLPQVNAHWKINLTGELVEGSQVAQTDRCAFITYFIYRKMADVAVALQVDYFDNMILFGPHLQQVLVADNLGVRHAVFDTAWTTEGKREQFVKWSCEQSF